MGEGFLFEAWFTISNTWYVAVSCFCSLQYAIKCLLVTKEKRLLMAIKILGSRKKNSFDANLAFLLLKLINLINHHKNVCEGLTLNVN